jgi:GNAT superfamily N-acetyltransferase
VADLTQRPDTARASLTIRRAIRGDVPAIVGLFASDGLGGHADTTDPEALPDYLDAFDWITAQASTALFVAVLGNEVVGTFQTGFSRSLSNRGAAVLTVMAVQTRADLRGRGIGARMMDHAAEEARRLGAVKIRLSSNAARTDAHRFYERLGFSRSHAGFTKKVE